MMESGKSFLAFQEARQKDFRRIARDSRRDYTAEDVCNEAWLIAAAVEQKRGRPVDFSDKDDQELVIGWLYRELVTFSEKRLRYAVELDKGWDLDDSDRGTRSLLDVLAAPEHFDPLARLQAEQEQMEILEITKRSYSQFSAYIILMHRVGWDLEGLADLLRVVVKTLQNRITASHQHMKLQPSIFDRVVAVEHDFQPMANRVRCPPPIFNNGPPQLCWAFE